MNGDRFEVEALLTALGYRYDAGTGREAPAWRHPSAYPIEADWLCRPNRIANDLDLARFIAAQGFREGERAAQKAMRAALGLAYGFPRD